MRVACYQRVSSDDQAKAGSSEQQRLLLERYCHERGWDVAGTYTDDGVSGTVPVDQRPAGLQLLTDAEQHRFDLVLVYQVDRLGRDPLVVLSAIQRLEQAKVRVQSMNEAFDPSDPLGKFLVTMLSGIGRLVRDQQVQRSVDNSNQRARGGQYLGTPPPYGYRVEGHRATARLVIDDSPIPGFPHSPADVMRLIFQTLADGGTCWQAATLVNSLGIPSPRANREHYRTKALPSGQWGNTTIAAMVRRTAYKGVFQRNRHSTRGEPIIETPCPALVSEDLWERAQAQIFRNRSISPRNVKNTYLLRGLIRCGRCGRAYVGETQHRPYGDYRYYRCALRGKRQTGSCDGPRLEAERAERSVWERVEGWLRDSDQQEFPAEIPAPSNPLATNLRARLEALQRERERAVTLHVRGLIEDDDLAGQLQRIKGEESTLRDLLAREEAQERQATRRQVDQVERDAEIARCVEVLNSLGDAGRRQVLEMAVERVVVEDRELRIVFRWGNSLAN
jgi:site-specific DNA recombinase